ncbi:hypothetical protein, partial [Vibrio vulnificus]
MSIKQSIAFFLLFFGVSFSASAGYCKIQWGSSYDWAVSGNVIETSKIVLKTEHKWASSCEVKDGRITVVMGYSVSGCPAGMELNQSGVCE